MKVPQLIIIETNVFLLPNGGTREASEDLIQVCDNARIPLYITGSGFSCARIQPKIKDRVAGIHRLNHSSATLWYSISVQNEVKPGDMFYLGADSIRRIAASGFGMTPIAVAEGNEEACAENIHTKNFYTFKNLDTFLCALKKTLEHKPS